uniref:Uncharacterized protein n=1 Tax=Molossus molossus TaxID=27622 RepID=A0A7J8FYS8_MOLMO|nr:hypothetical protein HJG59_008155 [Molossus molossus]
MARGECLRAYEGCQGLVRGYGEALMCLPCFTLFEGGGLCAILLVKGTSSEEQCHRRQDPARPSPSHPGSSAATMSFGPCLFLCLLAVSLSLLDSGSAYRGSAPEPFSIGGLQRWAAPSVPTAGAVELVFP